MLSILTKIMDIRKAFTSSFENIRKNKKVAVPFFVSLILPMILIFVYMYITGLYGIAVDALQLAQEYDEVKAEYVFNKGNIGKENYTIKALSYLSGKGEYREGLVDYLEKKDVFEDVLDAFNFTNILIGIMMFIVLIVTSVYLSAATYSGVLLAIHNKKINYANVIKLANRFWLRLFSAYFLMGLIVLLPLSLAAGLMILALAYSAVIGILFVFLFIIFLIVFVLYIGIKLLFVAPIIFFEDLSAKDSIKKSFEISRGNFKTLLIIFGIIYGISTVMGSVGFTPVYDSIIGLILSDNVIKSLLLFIFVVFFLVIGAFINAFEDIFLFYSYQNFKGKR